MFQIFLLLKDFFLVMFQEVFNFLLRSFHAAHSLIVQEEGTLTTLTACVVLPISDSKNKEGKITMKCLTKQFPYKTSSNEKRQDFLNQGRLSVVVR